MSINIKQPDGLKRLSQTIEFYKQTSDSTLPEIFGGDYNDLLNKPIVDGIANADIIESNSNIFYVQDNNGNVIATIDEMGVHSIDFNANGHSVVAHIASTENQFARLESNLDLHTTNTDIHITAAERAKWNDPLSADDDTLYIADNNGHILALFNNEGLTVYNVKINDGNNQPIDLRTKIESIDQHVANSQDTFASIETKIKDLKDRLDPIDEVLDTTDTAQFAIADDNGNIAFQVDNQGTYAANLTITKSSNDTSETNGYDVADLLYSTSTNLSSLENNHEQLKGDFEDAQAAYQNHTNDVENGNAQPHVAINDRTLWNTVSNKAEQSSLDTTNNNLTTEIADRKTADQNLQDSINHESEERIAEDAAINNRTAEIESTDNGILLIADENGVNAIAQFDADGLTTTNIKTGSINSTGNVIVNGNFTSNADTTINANLTVVENASAKNLQISENVEIQGVLKLNTINNVAQTIEDIQQAAITDRDNLANNYYTKTETNTNINTAIANLVDSAPETLNTLNELAAAIQNHEDEYDALLEVVGSKTSQSDFEDHLAEFDVLNQRTEGIDADESGTFTITDEDGNPAFQVSDGQTTAYVIKTNEVIATGLIQANELKSTSQATNDLAVAADASIGGNLSVGAINNLEQTITNLNAKDEDLNAAINSHYTFKTISNGTTNLEADSVADVLTIQAGNNVTVDINTSTDTLTINSTYTNTAHTHSVGQGLEITGTGGVDGNVSYNAKAGDNIVVNESGINLAEEINIIDITANSGSIDELTVAVELTTPQIVKNGDTFIVTDDEGNSAFQIADGETTTYAIKTNNIETKTASIMENINMLDASVEGTLSVGDISDIEQEIIDLKARHDDNTAHTHSVGNGLEITGTGGISGVVTYQAKAGSNIEVDSNGIHLADNISLSEIDVTTLTAEVIHTPQIVKNGDSFTVADEDGNPTFQVADGETTAYSIKTDNLIVTDSATIDSLNVQGQGGITAGSIYADDITVGLVETDSLTLNGISINSLEDGANNYVLPTASTSVKGGIKISSLAP